MKSWRIILPWGLQYNWQPYIYQNELVWISGWTAWCSSTGGRLGRSQPLCHLATLSAVQVHLVKEKGNGMLIYDQKLYSMIKYLSNRRREVWNFKKIIQEGISLLRKIAYANKKEKKKRKKKTLQWSTANRDRESIQFISILKGDIQKYTFNIFFQYIINDRINILVDIFE